MRFERKASFRSTGRSADADMEGIWTYLKNAMDVLIPGNGNAGSANTGMNFILNREERRGATTKDRVALRNKALNLTARTPQVNAALDWN
jgi:hypothetical protein